MNSFKQIIRFENSEANKVRVIEFIKNLHTSEKLEHEVTIKPYKSSKSLEQLGYYFSSVVHVAADFQGLTNENAHQWLKDQCCERVYFSTLDGESHQFTPRIAKMKVKIMAEYIDSCINLLGSHGQYVPPPHYKQ